MGNNGVRLAGVAIFVISVWLLQIGLLGAFLIGLLMDLLWRYKLTGSITLTELKNRRESVAITDVTKIQGRFWRNPFIPDNLALEVHTANHCMVITVNEREAFKLIRTKFCNWVIGTAVRDNKYLLAIRPCNPGIPKLITYDAVGRYAFSLDVLIKLLLFFVLGASVVYSFGLINVWLLTGLLFTPYLFFIPSYIAKIQVTIDEKGIVIKDADNMRFLPFAEIKLVEKGFYRIKITTKSGEHLYLPRACYMLGELIEEFSKEEQQRTIDIQDAK